MDTQQRTALREHKTAYTGSVLHCGAKKLHPFIFLQ